MRPDLNPPDCPAQHGTGTDIITADFTLTMHDQPATSHGRRHAVTEISGYFAGPGQDATNALVTATLKVPATSPEARLARRIITDRAALARTEDSLRADITCCPCWADEHCPALSQNRLLQALHHAAGQSR